VRSFAADRHSAQARRFYEAVARIADARVGHEPTVAAVVQDLMCGGLAAFRGATTAELVAHIVARAGVHEGAPTPPDLVAELDLALHVAPPGRSRSVQVVPLRIVRAALADTAAAANPVSARLAKVARQG
jgi:hypothetical protein